MIFSFIIGLEVRAYLTKFHENDARVFFGTTRTYAFLGILGFILYEIVEITTTVSQILYKDIPKYGILLSVGRSGKTTAESKIILPKVSNS